MVLLFGSIHQHLTFFQTDTYFTCFFAVKITASEVIIYYYCHSAELLDIYNKSSRAAAFKTDCKRSMTVDVQAVKMTLYKLKAVNTE